MNRKLNINLWGMLSFLFFLFLKDVNYILIPSLIIKVNFLTFILFTSFVNWWNDKSELKILDLKYSWKINQSYDCRCLVAIHVVLCAILGNVLTLGNVRKRCQSVVNAAARKRTSCVKRSRAGRSWNVTTYVSKKRNARKR